MNILIVSRGIPTKEEPQFGCFEKDQAEALAKVGHNVVVISVDSRFRFRWRKLGVTIKKTNNVTFFNLFLIPGKITAMLGSWFDLWFKQQQLLFLYKKAYNFWGCSPDVVYSHFYGITRNAVILKNKFNVPLIGAEHAAIFNNDIVDIIHLKRAKYAYSYTDAIITVSENLKNRIKFHFNKDSYVVNNVIGTEFGFNNKNIKNREKVKFISIGSLEKRKGFDILLDALFKLELEKNLWELNIIGQGEEYESLLQQIKVMSLEDNVHLLGSKTKNEIVSYLKESDVFVLASHSETFGVVYIEALMMGLPVIATICGGPEEFVQKTDGLLIPTDDVDALADAIKYMFENYQSYDGAKIAEDCKNRFSPEVIARQLTDVFEKVVEEHKQKQLK